MRTRLVGSVFPGGPTSPAFSADVGVFVPTDEEPRGVKVPARVLFSLSRRSTDPDMLRLIETIQFALLLDEAEKSK